MKIQLIFPARPIETARSSFTVMPLSLTLLAALTPRDHDLKLIDMFTGDQPDYEMDVDLVGITVRTPVAIKAYEIADEFIKRGKKVILGGPHVFAIPEEAKRHATAISIGEADKLWPIMLQDADRGELKDFYINGPYNAGQLQGLVHHDTERPDLAEIPMMRRDLLPRERYFMDSIFTTRGCPNHCRFCPVTNIFGAKIRHRPVEKVVAEVETLGKRYFNVDDSVFGHPQLVDRPQENQYYLDLYRELAKLRPVRQWTGAGGLSAIDYKDGRKILELAAKSGLSSVAAGLESITCEGQKQSGAWRKLHFRSSDTFDLKKMKQNIRSIQSLGIQIHGFFIIGWDQDTPETYRRTLEFCDECNIIPYIFTLNPMPGSQIYREYLEQGRMLTDQPWDHYGGGFVIFRHPTMSSEEMFEMNKKVMLEGYGTGKILKRTLRTIKNQPSPKMLMASFFTQLGIKKAYKELYSNKL
jgi:radical SAM superfamily enzyme YgiQ (UPF0313 family)